MTQNSQKPLILICDDDSTFHLSIKYALKNSYDFRSAYNTEEAFTLLKKERVDALLLDIEMRTPEEGLKAIPRFKESDPDLVIIMSSGKTDFQSVREAMRLGAADYVPKHFDSSELECALERVFKLKALLQKNAQHNFEVSRNQKRHVLVGGSALLEQIRKSIPRIRSSTANVVITGETGTGKEVVARQLRPTSPDGSLAPFIAVDSATIQSTTAESLLFGHEKGAFTGAERTTKGIFEEANGGTVYFDEIANMPLEIQAKLLRILQEKELTRMGSTKVIPLDFRVICATNKNLESLVKAGQFKDDLLQRLNVVPIYLPPLREHTEDIPELIEHFMKLHAPPGGGLKFTTDAAELLKIYPWPGNVRELRNLIAFLLTLIEGTEVDISDLPPKIRDQARETPTAEEDNHFYTRVSAFEREILAQEYKRQNGNVSRIALSLGMDRSHLYTKLREYGLHQTRPTD